MADLAELPKEDLERARDLGAITYCNAYIRLMARELGVDVSDTESVNAMMIQMVEPMNHATEAIWRAMMGDHKGLDETLKRFHDSLKHV